MEYKVLVVGCNDIKKLGESLGDQFSLLDVATAQETFHLPDLEDYKLVIVLDKEADGTGAQAQVRALKHHPVISPLPVVVLATEERDLESRLAFYNAGCDDHIQFGNGAELQVRLMKAIFNRIANEQLKQQLDKANEMAFIAMSDTSDLGVNIQFLLDINQCENLDQAGMRLFQALKSYNISSSLQIRSRFGEKNMEANGMAKDLESTLLRECSEMGRYVDFGKRSIMNYGRVSLLVRNMPVDDPNKYGAIKDNVFSLLQGLDARVGALDNVESLKLESKLVVKLTSRMTHIMENIDKGYHDVMVRIADAVEDIADGIEQEIQFLGMDEQQERVIQKVLENGILETSRVFNEGLKMDKSLTGYLSEVGRVFASDKVKTEELMALVEKIPANG